MYSPELSQLTINLSCSTGMLLLTPEMPLLLPSRVTGTQLRQCYVSLVGGDFSTGRQEGAASEPERLQGWMCLSALR